VSRLHPFGYAFSQLAETQFAAIRAQVPDETMDLATMAGLPSVHDLVRDVSKDLAVPNPRAADEYLAILFAAYRFWRAGEHTFSVARKVLANAIADPPATAPNVPHDACYLQLPERWFWGTIGEDQPHEPLDGMFVVGATTQPQFTVVAVLGLRPGRDGFSQVMVSSSLADVLAAGSTMRAPPFAAVMDGGIEAGFQSVTSEGELLHLAHLALHSVSE
jgi:hypothetical protein